MALALINLIFLKVKNSLLDIFFPKFCAGCGKEGNYICDNCSLFIGEAPLIYTGDGLKGLVSVWEYQGIMKKLLSDIKYKKVSDIIDDISKKAFRVIVNDVSRFSDFLSFLFYGDTYITYVPMYKNKEKDRGFNQAELIAEEIGKITGKKVVPLLKKIKDTESQAKLSRKARLVNLKDAFECRKCSRFQNLVLVDDIYTTGATMRECCKILKKAGAKKVWGFTLARTV